VLGQLRKRGRVSGLHRCQLHEVDADCSARCAWARRAARWWKTSGRAPAERAGLKRTTSSPPWTAGACRARWSSSATSPRGSPARRCVAVPARTHAGGRGPVGRRRSARARSVLAGPSAAPSTTTNAASASASRIDQAVRAGELPAPCRACSDPRCPLSTATADLSPRGRHHRISTARRSHRRHYAGGGVARPETC